MQSTALTATPEEFLAYIRNVDPQLEPAIVDAFTPKGTCRVATSPHFVFVVSNILRGMSPVEISSMVEREKLAFIPASQIRDYQIKYIPPALMRSHIIFRSIQKENQKLDEVEVLEALTKLQLARVMSRADAPRGDVEDQESVRRDIDLCHKMAVASLDAKIKTGRVKQAPKEVNITGAVDHTHDTPPSLAVSEDGRTQLLDPRIAAAALRAIERVAQMGAVAVPELEAITSQDPDKVH